MGWSQTVRVLQFNLWNLSGDAPARMAELRQLLERLEPDICCFQETVVGARGPSHEQAWEPLGYRGFHCPIPAWPGAIVNGGNYGNTTVTRLSAGQPKVQQLPAGPWDESRFAASVELELASGAPLQVINTHLSWRPDDDDTRASQVQTILDHFRPVDDRRVLVCGDLNTQPDSEAVRLFVEDGFRDAWAQHGSGPGATWSHHNPNMGLSAVYDRRIDYILYSSKLECASVDLIGVEPMTGTWASDHFGLFAEIDIR